jgi:hypothetical protein
VSTKQQLLAAILTYSGTLPFLACVAAAYMALTYVDMYFVTLAYGAVILSFISGIHWGVFLFKEEQSPRNLFITSNITASLAWFTLLLYPNPLAFLIQVLSFVYLYALDYSLWKKDIIDDGFYRLRRNATMIVTFSLLVLMALM